MRTLDEIRETESKTTKSAWRVDKHGITIITDSPEKMIQSPIAKTLAVATLEERRANANFISHAKQDIPYLLTLVGEQQKEIDRLREIVSRYHTSVGGYSNTYGKSACRWCGEKAKWDREVKHNINCLVAQTEAALEDK